MQKGKVWIVDDDSAIRWVLERALNNAHMECTSFEDIQSVLIALEKTCPDVLISDIHMPDNDGLTLLTRLKQSHPKLPIIIMTAHSDLNTAVNAYQEHKHAFGVSIAAKALYF